MSETINIPNRWLVYFTIFPLWVMVFLNSVLLTDFGPTYEVGMFSVSNIFCAVIFPVYYLDNLEKKLRKEAS